MRYPYRHPDLAEREARAQVEQPDDFSQKERRRFDRPLPVADVTHSADDDAWALWDEAIDDGSSQRN